MNVLKTLALLTSLLVVAAVSKANVFLDVFPGSTGYVGDIFTLNASKSGPGTEQGWEFGTPDGTFLGNTGFRQSQVSYGNAGIYSVSYTSYQVSYMLVTLPGGYTLEPNYFTEIAYANITVWEKAVSTVPEQGSTLALVALTAAGLVSYRRKIA